MGLIDQGILYRDEQCKTILPIGNTLSTEQEKWQDRGYIYNKTGEWWDFDPNRWYVPETQQWFYEGMEKWNLDNMERTQNELDRMNQDLLEQQRLAELDFLREQQNAERERWKTGDVTVGEVMSRFGEIKKGQAYVFDQDAGKWTVKSVNDLTGDEKAYTYTGADYQEGLEYVKEVYSQYQQLQTDISSLIDQQIAAERADYEMRGVEYNISDDEIQRRKEDKFNEMVSEEERLRMDELLAEFGTPQTGPFTPSETLDYEAYQQSFIGNTQSPTAAPTSPSTGSLLLEEE